jgi:cytochrome c biogenesis protein CcmG/thiol:disulfide interchange protein DsbE
MRFLAVLATLAVFGVLGVRIVHALNPPQPLDLGGKLTLPDGPVVINVWASWCEACRVEAQTIADFERAHPDVPIVGVDADRDAAAGANAAASWGWHHTNIWDPQARIGQKLAPDGLPTTIFLDSQHRVVTKILGAASRDQLEQGLAKTSA